MRPIRVAIDGPAGAGKSTVARMVAERLNLLYIDSGAMYRALTLAALDRGISMDDESSLVHLANSISLRLDQRNGKQMVFVDGQDVTSRIRTPAVNAHVSEVARIAGVRERMVTLQRELSHATGVVMDGRDIGTCVLPHAEVKIFLTASLRERARRRLEELKDEGYDVALADVEKDLAKRDRLDEEREYSPLKKADDAHVIDTTGRTAADVANEIVNICSRYFDTDRAEVE